MAESARDALRAGVHHEALRNVAPRLALVYGIFQAIFTPGVALS
ncbi:hypothetical protein [Burkholderia sp. Ax-1719]|nr:hypothetical protein [Burkholderia sp. Ax-1719]